MAIKCPQCGAEYDVTLFTLDRSIRCDCGARVDLVVGHQQIGQDAMHAVSPEASRVPVSSDARSMVVSARRPWEFLWLVVVHVVLVSVGVLAACYADPSYDSMYHPAQLVAGMFIGLVFSQTSLLATWGSLGQSPWWKRLIGVAAGVGYLGPLLGIGVDELDSAILILVIVATLLVAIPLLIARSLRVAIRKDLALLHPASRVQFSIRHLLVLMLVVACMISVGQLIRDHLDNLVSSVMLFSIATASAVVGVLPVWCVLDVNWRIRCTIGLFFVAVCAGYGLGSLYSGSAAIWICAMVTEALAVVLTLMIVRCWGYRLVRLPR